MNNPIANYHLTDATCLSTVEEVATEGIYQAYDQSLRELARDHGGVVPINNNGSDLRICMAEMLILVCF